MLKRLITAWGARNYLTGEDKAFTEQEGESALIIILLFTTVLATLHSLHVHGGISIRRRSRYTEINTWDLTSIMVVIILTVPLWMIKDYNRITMYFLCKCVLCMVMFCSYKACGLSTVASFMHHSKEKHLVLEYNIADVLLIH